MPQKSALRLFLLLLLALALPSAGNTLAAQVPEAGITQAPFDEAESQRIADAAEEALAATRAFDARNEQVEANLIAVRQVIESKANGSGVGDVLREARRRAPVLADLERSLRHQQRLLAEARVEKVRLLERQRLAESLTAKEAAQQDLADLEVLLNALIGALESAKELQTNSKQLIDYLDGHLLWLRSAEPIGASWLHDVSEGALWLTSPQNWRGVGAELYQSAKDEAPATSAVLLALAALFLVRRRLRRVLPELASAVGRVSTDSFVLTLRALLFTLLLTLPIPLILIGTGALLDSGDHSAVGRAISRGLYAAGSVFLLLDFARQLCRAKGLAEIHFRWNERARKVLRSNLRWLIVFEVVSAFLVASCDASHVDVYRLGLGRLAFIAGSAGLSVFLALVFHPTRGAFADLLAREGWAWRLRKLWYGLLVLAPFGLAVAAALGYYHTATEVQSRLFTTGLVALTGVVVYSLLERGLLVARRRLAVQQARQRLEQAREARAKREDSESKEGMATGDAVPELELGTIDVAAISSQTLALVRTLVVLGTAIVLWVVWSQVLPALTVLDGITISKPTLDPSGEVIVPALTLWSLLSALLTALLTYLAARNLPSILEFAILTRFRVDAGARYAAGALTRYGVIALGVALVSRMLGVDWSKAQWIIAALGVGLGFGLQEIVANFVSGLIILFERPIRVGDTVTVGSDSGTVSKLQIRATTITDWDNKEILVPNKNFITERVVNWTLSNPVTRVVAKVGVAYGTDIAKARDAITRAVKSVPSVLENPASSVFFLGFGDSSLDFEVRAFVDDLSKRLPTLHELHFAINQALAEAEIEIPFPQRDLHVRSDDTKSRPPAADLSDEAPST
ncbi:MAG: mechanosensitive ion channel [Planctomycetes bacterium]|nr:mechanosensitive ion channel [Planctomycetota bacterium]MCB9903218.1 mechanosensitive ion channel [Planctomycetota bacterium]